MKVVEIPDNLRIFDSSHVLVGSRWLDIEASGESYKKQLRKAVWAQPALMDRFSARILRLCRGSRCRISCILPIAVYFHALTRYLQYWCDSSVAESGRGNAGLIGA
jgi:hypothetical protein